MGKALLYNCRVVGCVILLAGLMLMGPAISRAADAVCARVKIEIKQELTLERQGFDAHMRINNGLASVSLENVGIEVAFSDKDGNPVVASSDPDHPNALFFIRLDSMENIDDVSGVGLVGPSTSADIHWLIIPAPGASNGLESGALYYVGAKLTYTIGGEQKVTEVTPDYIFVKPMPEITLDYFLPTDVYGDDAFTADIEPSIPFSLGVRVGNNGSGVASELKIESAQPKIVENDQGLLIGFAITGSEVNGQSAGDSLLVDFGNIEPGTAGTARWIMTCSLSGKFIDFEARYTHSDELGGELTSLLTAANTHFLVRDVLVDLAGRDAVRDFLALDGAVYRVYESDAVDTEVTDQSSLSELELTGATSASLSTPVTAGLMVVKLTDPFDGQKVLAEVTRSDGKRIKPENVWLSSTRDKNLDWHYYLNLFDVNSPGIYTFRFEDTSAVPLPPVLQYIADKTVLEGERVSFVVEASDPSGTAPTLAAAPLPVGAEFVDEGNGRGVLEWTPAEGQAGVYEIIYRASDGVLEASRRATLTVQGFRDTDADDLDDDWELQHFGTLARDGSGDFDRDGISDLDEFENGTDPADLADMVIHQAADNLNPAFGDELVLTITATNNGPRDATGVQIVDLLSGGLNYLNDDSGDRYDHTTGIWDIGELPASGPDNTVTLTITAEVMRTGKVLNVAAVTGSDLYDPDHSNNSAALIFNGGTQSDLAISQTIDNLRPEAGDVVAVALTVTNNGVDDATGVQIEELLPVGLSYESTTIPPDNYDQNTGVWLVGDLASGDGAELQLILTVDNIDEIILSAAITGSDQPDPDPTNNRATIVINQDLLGHPYVADLALYKLANQAAVDVGGQAVFTLLVRNNGPDDAGNVEIDDLLPDGLDFLFAIPRDSYDKASELWQVKTLPAGALAMMDMIVDVTEAGDQDNMADIVSLSEFDPDSGNDFDTRSVTGLAVDILVNKTVDNGTAYVGDPVVFSITVTNNGPNDANGVRVLDQLPAGLNHQSSDPPQGTYDPDTGVWEIGDLSNGASVTLQITAVVEQSGDMTNTATKTASSPTDINADNNSDDATVTGYAPPVVSDIPGQTIDEGELFLTIDLDNYVNDADNAPDQIDWTYSGATELSVDIDDGTHVAAITIPHPDWHGSETITFIATDPAQLSDSNSAVFTVRNVNDPPVGKIDTFDVDEDLILTMPAPGVLGNDSDIDSLEVTAVLVEGVKSGTLILSSDGSFRYAPNGNFHGNDSFSYKANDGLDDSGVVTVTIVVNPVNDAPVANAGGPYASEEGTSIAFNASPSSDIDNDELRYRWDFNGDGLWDTEYSTEPIATYTWYDDHAGTVVAEVFDGNVVDTSTASVTVSDVPPTVTISGPASVPEGAVYSLSMSAVDPGNDTIASWSINWGDGAVDTLEDNPNSAIHSYADNGGFTITASATNEDGTYDAEVDILVTVNNVSSAVSAGNDAAIDEGDTFSSTGSFTDPGADEWTATVDYGDGSGAQALDLNEDKTFALSHTYAENGTYTVTVTVSDDEGAAGSDTAAVTVNNVAPAANAGDNQAVNEGDLVSFSGGFTDPGADTHTIEWDFGDGASATGTLTPAHSYGDNGTYTVTVTVTDDDGGAGTGALTVVVANVAPVITGLTSDNPSTGEVHLTAAFADPGWLDSHSSRWDFGDGAAADSYGAEENEKSDTTGTMTTVHNYAAEGLFTVSVTVKDDDGADSALKTIDVLIDKTAPAIEVFEPQAGYYRNTDEIMVDLAVADPESGGVSSGLDPESVVVILDGKKIEADELLDLSKRADGLHTLYVAASDYAGNSAAQEVRFEVGPVPALVHIQPHNWDLKWLDPFDIEDGHDLKDTIKAEISLENAEVETVIPTDKAARLKIGDGYGDFVVVDVVAAQTGAKSGKENVVSLTLKYVGVDEMDILAFSGDTVLDFFSVNTDDEILIDGSQAGHLGRHTVLSAYQSDPPLLSAADIIPETVLLNQWVPVIEDSAQLITTDAAALAQSGVIAEPPYGIVKEKKHHVWLANVGQPQQMTLEVGDRTIFADEPYPVNWQDWFSLDDEGRLQMMRIHVSGKDNLLQVLHHNLQAEARIYLDGDLALTILPETNLIAMEVLFDRFEVMSTIDREILQQGGDWLVTAHNGATLKGKHPRKHIRVSDIGHPQKARLMIGDTVVFEDQPFPVKWSQRYLIVGGERQDLSIKTHGARGNDPQLSINCKQLTHEAQLYLDNMLVLQVSPPPEVGVSISGELELDGDPATFDGSFRGSDAIELKGKLPKDFDPPMSYQRINTAGEPALQIGDRFGEFEIADFAEHYEEWRITKLEFSCDDFSEDEIKVYEDSRRKHLIDSYQADAGGQFAIDVNYLVGDRLYLEIGKKHDDIKLTGRKAAEIGDRFLDCTVRDISKIPLGAPHYIDLTLEYTGSADPISLTVYDGKKKEVIAIYEIDPAVNPVFVIDGSGQRKGYLGENLVLEYGSNY